MHTNEMERKNNARIQTNKQTLYDIEQSEEVEKQREITESESTK